MRVEAGVAVGDVTAAGATGDLYYQAVPTDGPGAAGGGRVLSFPLNTPAGPLVVRPPGGGDPPAPADGDRPPAGWKEYSPKDRTFAVWVPDRPAREGTRDRTATVNGRPLRVNVFTSETAAGVLFRAESVILPPEFAGLPRADVYGMIRNVLRDEINGRITESTEFKVAGIGGAEYRVEAGRLVTRARVLVLGAKVYIVSASGTGEQVAAADAETFLNSYRVPNRAGVPPSPSPQPPLPTPTPPGPSAGRGPRIQGGGGDPEFADSAPAGGVLVGLEVGVGRWFNNPVIKSARPVFRTGGGDSLGAWHGPTGPDIVKEVVRAVARPGYAVAAVTVKNGSGTDGLSLTFMRVAADGRLDALDAYESEWLGGRGGGGPVRVGGDGTPVVGLIGKARGDTLSGMGLAYREVTETPPAPVSPLASLPASPPVVAEPTPVSPAPSPKAGATPTATTAVADDAPKEKSRLPFIVGLIAGLVVCLGAVVGGVLVYARGGTGGSRDEDDDGDDEEERGRRPRGRRRS